MLCSIRALSRVVPLFFVAACITPRTPAPPAGPPAIDEPTPRFERHLVAGDSYAYRATVAVRLEDGYSWLRHEGRWEVLEASSAHTGLVARTLDHLREESHTDPAMPPLEMELADRAQESVDPATGFASAGPNGPLMGHLLQLAVPPLPPGGANGRWWVGDGRREPARCQGRPAGNIFRVTCDLPAVGRVDSVRLAGVFSVDDGWVGRATVQAEREGRAVLVGELCVVRQGEAFESVRCGTPEELAAALGASAPSSPQRVADYTDRCTARVATLEQNALPWPELPAEMEEALLRGPFTISPVVARAGAKDWAAGSILTLEADGQTNLERDPSTPTEETADEPHYVIARPGSTVRDLVATAHRLRSPRLVVFEPSGIDAQDLVPDAPEWVRDRILMMRDRELGIPMTTGVADRVDQLRVELAGASSACPAVDVDFDDPASPAGPDRVRRIAEGLRACSCGNVDVDTIEAALVLERDELSRVGWVALGGGELRALRRMGRGAILDSAIEALALSPLQRSW